MGESGGGEVVGDLSTWGSKLGAESCLVTVLLVITVATAETEGYRRFLQSAEFFNPHCARVRRGTPSRAPRRVGWRPDPHPEWAKGWMPGTLR